MKKFFMLLVIAVFLMSAMFVPPAMASWQGTFTWVKNTDPAVSGYQILMDGTVVVDSLDPATTTASYTVPEITGQSFVLRTLGLGGEYTDSDPIIAVKAPPASSGFSVEFVYVE